MTDDLLTLINLARSWAAIEAKVLDYPILFACCDCGAEWFAQTGRATCPKCYGSVICTPIAACPDCYRAFVNIATEMRCEHCGSNEIIRESDDEYPYMNNEEWEKACKVREVTDA